MARSRDSDDDMVLLSTVLASSSRRVSLVVATPGLTSHSLSVQWKDSSVHLAQLGAQTISKAISAARGLGYTDWWRLSPKPTPKA